MYRISDSWKRYPLLVLGDGLRVAVPGAELALPDEAGSFLRPDMNNFYLLVAVPPPAISAALASVARSGASPDQVVIFLPPCASLTEALPPFHGLLDALEGESEEDLRARLFSRLESQRQKKLPWALDHARESGIARRLGEAELQKALDSARIAHAIACSYSLAPRDHAHAIETCLKWEERPLSPWNASLPVGQLVAEAARFLAETAPGERPLRDALREKAAGLPFRARTDLLHHVESSLGLLLKGKPHAA